MTVSTDYVVLASLNMQQNLEMQKCCNNFGGVETRMCGTFKAFNLLVVSTVASGILFARFPTVECIAKVKAFFL